MAFLVGNRPPHANPCVLQSLLRHSGLDPRNVRLAVEDQVHGAARRRRHEFETGARRTDVPEQEALVALLAVMEAADRAGIGDDAPVLFPVLVAVDVAEHEGLGLGCEQRARRELVIEARHRNAVLGDAPGDRAMRHPDRRHLRLPGRLVDRAVASQQRRQFLAQGDAGVCRADAGGDDRLVDGGHAGEDHAGPDRHVVESPVAGRAPGAGREQCNLTDPVGHMDAVPPPQQPEDRQRSRWFVRVRALQHQDRAVIRQPAHLARQSFDGRTVHIKRVVGRVPRNDGHLRTAPDRLVDREAEAPVGFRQVLFAVVQVGKLRDPDHESTSARVCS